MNKRIKKLWIKALRSGKYKQGINQLKTHCAGNTYKHCCLGVLEEIAVKEGVIKRIAGTFLTKKVQKWAGLNEKNPQLGKQTAAKLNDNGKSFNFIADRIEKFL